MRHLAGRLLQSAAIVVLVATLTFVLIHLAPGDPLSAGASGVPIPTEVREQLQRNFGLDQPLHIRYVRYLTNLARGNLGYSFAERRPVAEAIGARLSNTLVLAGSGLIVMFGLGVAIGAVQGARPGSRQDTALSLATLALYSMPVFWLGVMLILLFGQQLHWFPMTGTVDPTRHAFLSPVGQLWDRLRHLILPALTLGVVGAAVIARYQRAAMLEVIRQDFVRTARAKGLTEGMVMVRHALRNALLPTITLFGLAFPILLSGAVLVEAVFGWPGLGKLAVDSIARRDYYVVTASGIIAGVMVVVGNLVADGLYLLADPRTRERA
jgi:peptide/nickel transport system permease protein